MSARETLAAEAEHSGAFWLAFAAFAINHIWSYRYNREQDRHGTPNIGTLMLTPNWRVVPMHLMVFATDPSFQVGDWNPLIFGALRTVADVGIRRGKPRTRWQITFSN